MDNENLKIWYIYKNNNQYGPFEKKEIIKFIQNNTINSNDYLWDISSKTWKKLTEFDLFKTYIKQITEPDSIESKFEIADNLKLKGTKISYHNYRKGNTERMYKRLKLKIPAEIKNDKVDSYIKVEVENISATGISVSSRDLKDFSENDKIFIKLYNNATGKYINIIGKVVREHKLVSARKELGIKFIDMDKYEGQELLNILSWNSKTYI